MHARKENKAAQSSFKALLWTAIAGLIFGLIGFGEIAEDLLRAGRNSIHWHKASGTIALVRIDDESVRDISAWPWKRRHYAELTDKLTKAGAKRIFFNLPLYGPTEARDDRQFAEALKRSGRAVLAVKTRSGPNSGAQQWAVPYAPLAKYARLGSITAQYNYQNAVWRIPYAVPSAEGSLPSFATLLANREGPENQTFMVDYSIDPASIPTVSAGSVLRGGYDEKLIRGRDVVIGTATEVASDYYFIPGTGKMGSSYFHIIGAETLKSGTPSYFGWIPLFLATLVVCALALQRHSPQQQFAMLGGAFVALVFGPAALESRLIFLDITPGLFVLVTIMTVLGLRHYKQRGLVSAVSGLLNLNALRNHRAGRDRALIVARIMNYAEIVAAFPSDSEKQLVDQIVSRLSLGSKDRTFFHGDGGVFAWFEESEKPWDPLESTCRHASLSIL